MAAGSTPRRARRWLPVGCLAVALALSGCGGTDPGAPGQADDTADDDAADDAGADDTAAPTSSPAEPSTSTTTATEAAGREERTAHGLGFRLPDGHSWSISQDEPARFVAMLDGSFATSITLEALDDSIDDWLAQQDAFYAQEGYEVPDPWWRPVDVPGSPRAVDVDWISGSGDLRITARLVEVGDRAVLVDVSQYIEDLDLLHADEVEAFLASLRVAA